MRYEVPAKKTVSRSKLQIKLLKFYNRLKITLSNPVYSIGIVAIVLLFLLIIVPMWEIVSTTFKWQIQDARISADAEPGKFTFYHWIHMLNSDISWSML